MRNQPDRLTERVVHLLAAARTSPLTRDDVMEQLTLALRRNLSYVARKERSGQHTLYCFHRPTLGEVVVSVPAPLASFCLLVE